MKLFNQKGQIAILLPIIILIAGLLLFNIPKGDKQTVETGCLIGVRPPEKFRTLPAIRNFSEGNDHDDTYRKDGGPDLSKTKRYRLVREKVPVDKIDRAYGNPLFPRGSVGQTTQHFVRYNNQTIDGVTFEVYYPNIYGESTLDGSFQWKYDSSNPHDLQFHQEGFLFFVRLKADGQPETIMGIDRVNNQEAEFYLVDLYQEESRYQASLTGARGYTYEDVFKCQAGGSGTSLKGVYPSVTGSTGGDKQLQLKYFTISSSNRYGFSSHCKPAIYLYPQETEKVNVEVKTKGELLYTKPLYPSSGWDVTAYPNGKIVYNGANYDYLYYESRIPDSLIDKPKEGFVVLYKELSTLYDQVLPKLGLSPKQVFDFKEYWEKVLPPSPYYFVGILSQENINQFEPLVINPKPATIIRVRFYFEALDEKIEVDEPVIKMPKKNGFTVVEWGGMVKRDKDHPFTCSE